MKTKDVAILGVLTALYVVMALTLKIPMGVGNIALDLGYIVLTVACVLYGWKALFIGGLGALIESVLFSAYGISYGWIVMNVIIGLLCGIVFTKIKQSKLSFFIYAGVIIVSVLLGVTAKTIIECTLYQIPYLVKIPKSAVAFGIDSFVMIVGLPIAFRLRKYAVKGEKKNGKN